MKWSSEIGPSGYSYQDNFSKWEPTPCDQLGPQLSKIHYNGDQLENATCLNSDNVSEFGLYIDDTKDVEYALMVEVNPCKIAPDNDCMVNYKGV